MLCAFEPVKYCMRGAAAVGGDEAQVGLEAALEQHARLGVAVAEHALDQAVLDEVVHQRRPAPEASDVEIAAGVAAAPQAADRLDGGVGRALAQVGDERRGGVVRVGQQMPAGEALALVERLEDERFLLRAHARAARGSGRRRGALEIVERADAELAIERRDGLRPDALQVQQVEDRRRKLGDAARGGNARVAGLGDLADARGEVLADAGNLAQPGLVERRRARADGWRRCRRRCGRRGS